MISNTGPAWARFEFKNVFYGWWIVLAGFCISFYVGSVFYGFTAFFEPLVKEFGWSYTQVSLASSFRRIEMSILAPLAGFLVDRVGSRLMIVCGIIIVSIGLISLSCTQSLWMFYLSYTLIGFGGGGCSSVVLVKCTVSWFSRDIGKASRYPRGRHGFERQPATCLIPGVRGRGA